MNPDEEFRRLIELMPASGRMYCKLSHQPQQTEVIAAKVPLPWQENRPIAINLELWGHLSEPQRDLLLLSTVSWLISIQWVKPDLYKGLTAVGLAGILLQFLRGDAAGMVVASGLTVLAASQIWRQSRSPRSQAQADEQAVQVAQWRGYAKPEAAQHLLEAVEAVAQLEGRPLTFNEQLRCQNLRSIAGLPKMTQPDAS